PFNSMFWAVQGIAAELTTGALVMQKIRESGKSISMLVANNNATFLKKAKGRITFKCTQGDILDEAIEKTIATGERQTIWMHSKGFNEEGIEVSHFNFEWTIKLKTSNN
ncbi:MAG: thioesterase, partial [Bacteroidia bacterium]|nr:thioesterase [Bacteroidia bacterium]